MKLTKYIIYLSETTMRIWSVKREIWLAFVTLICSNSSESALKSCHSLLFSRYVYTAEGYFGDSNPWKLSIFCNRVILIKITHNTDPNPNPKPVLHKGTLGMSLGPRDLKEPIQQLSKIFDLKFCVWFGVKLPKINLRLCIAQQKLFLINKSYIYTNKLILGNTKGPNPAHVPRASHFLRPA